MAATIQLIHILIFSTLFLFCYGGLADRFGSRRCADFLDCDEGECCVLNGSPFGKRGILDDLWGAVSEVFSPTNSTSSNDTTDDGDVVAPPDVVTDLSTTSNPTGGVDLSQLLAGLAGNIDLTQLLGQSGLGSMDIADVLGLVRSLNGASTTQNTTPDPKWEETIKALSESSQIKSFLEHHSETRGKPGVCRKLGADGDMCVNYLNGHTCPCTEGLVCKENTGFTFGGFGAIGGFHNLRCTEP